MWTKDIYQEQMLGYLGEVEADIEQLAHTQLQKRDLIETYVDLDVAVKRMWWLIGASDVDWEGFRSPLEISCDRLQHVFYQLLHPDAFMLSTHLIVTEDSERRVERWETVELLEY